MKVEWSESIDKGGMPLRECKVGRFWLVVQQDDDNGREWDAWVDAEYEWSSAEHREAARVPIGQSIGHKSCEDAQAAAAAMLAAMTAPFVDAARAEEREACAVMIEREREKRLGFAKTSATPEFYSGQAAVLSLAIDAIRARSKEPKP